VARGREGRDLPTRGEPHDADSCRINVPFACAAPHEADGALSVLE
jgi:hypothetical protein